MREDIVLEEELHKYFDTPFQKRCNNLSSEMSTILKNFGFTEKYLDFYRGKIPKEELITYVRNTLENLDEYTRHDLNHLWSMLSDKNCGWFEYKIGEIIHDQLMKIWYPKDEGGK